ncbi:TRAP transporter substrate-binding protein [Shinella zoogloeoides]|uniref:TRAP transporter substrate-binding protein n=1 Tax=Shinella zoogloeoides TaxID=352475 RepID=UPI000E65B3BB|nr:TRAP transporter substrate-binding protein [Shinella zoogloeoides]
MRTATFVGGAGFALLMSLSAHAVELKLAHAHQDSMESEIHTTSWLFQKYAQDFGTNFNVTIHPNNQLGQEREVYEAMQLGSGADCIISGTAILGNFEKKVGVLDLPFLWKDYDHVHRVLDGEVGAELQTALRDSGFEVIAWLDSWGYRNVATTNKAITNVEDLKGLKIRTIPTDTYVKAINAMGANATPMAFGEIYTAMETGVLDGLEHNASIILANKFNEVAHNYALTRHLFGPLAFVCSSTFVSSLSEADKATLQKAAWFARDAQRSLAPLREGEALKALADAGVNVTQVDTAPLQSAAASVQDELATSFEATGLLEKIRAAAK